MKKDPLSEPKVGGLLLVMTTQDTQIKTNVMINYSWWLEEIFRPLNVLMLYKGILCHELLHIV